MLTMRKSNVLSFSVSFVCLMYCGDVCLCSSLFIQAVHIRLYDLFETLKYSLSYICTFHMEMLIVLVRL